MGNLQSNRSSTTQPIEKKFEVFLNFRGETRDGFTNNLYECLRAKSVETFMDEPGLAKGDEIGPNLLKTIRDSMISVVIFSKKYAYSKWCLRELVEIMRCTEKNGQTVIPVFYNVTVSDVRHQEGSFKDGFDELQKRFYQELAKDRAAWTWREHVNPADGKGCMASLDVREKEFLQEMQNWREALEKASRVKGWDSFVTRPESKLIDQIVKDISENLMKAYKLSPCDFEGLVGFQNQFKQVKSLLCLDKTDIRIIGIWGMGGIGKTTLANFIYHQISDDEYCKCFIQNFRQRLEQYGGLVSELQKEVLTKVLNDQAIKSDSLTLSSQIKKRLYPKKVFIVLDDVDDFLKLEELARGIDQLGPGSRIVITTRNRDILTNCLVNDDYIYEMKGLSYPEAFQLFCQYARPTKDCLGFSDEIVRSINGNPLGLKVSGSSLLGYNKQKWESALSRLKTNPEILQVLQVSYNGLQDVQDKETFLDIACFYVGEHEDYVIEILGDCSYSLGVLCNRSLITISNSKIIQMHDLLQEMGREIVCKESLNNPGNRSRLWKQEDVLDTLKNNEGTNEMRGIFLNLSEMSKQRLRPQAFEKLKRLRYLKFYINSSIYDDVYISKVLFPDGLSYLSDKLRSLNWHGYSLKALPSNFIPTNLVELNLRYSDIEKLWEDNMHAPKLKWIILYSCPYLIKFLDLLEAPLLEKIHIQFCSRLLDFSSRVQHFNNLRELIIEFCGSLTSFLSTSQFPSLKYFRLRYCNKLTRISNFLDAPLLEKIDIQDCKNLLSFPSPIDHFDNLRELSLKKCKKLEIFPNKISFPSLVFLDLSGCINLTKISNHLDAPLLEKINLKNCKNLVNFPQPCQHFHKLSELNLNSCHSLESFPSDIRFPSLISLDLYECRKLTKISDYLDAPLLKKLDIQYCTSLSSFPSPVQHFNNLHELYIRDCKDLRTFPGSIPFKSLLSLSLYGCQSLTKFSCNLDAPLLKEINLQNCSGLLEFSSPVTTTFNNLHQLNIMDCKKLESFGKNIRLPYLISLNFYDCHSLTEFSYLLDGLFLEHRDIQNYRSLLGFSSPIDRFNNLHKLNMRDCKKLEIFPNKISFPSLISLNLSGCINLIRISDHLDAPLLEEINLKNCKKLVNFPQPAQHFNKLIELNLNSCQSLESFPSNIRFPLLKSLDLYGCIKLAKILDHLATPLLKKLDIRNCRSLLNFPSSVQHFYNLCMLKLWNSKNLQSFPNNIPFPSLVSFDHSGCHSLTEFSYLLDAPLLKEINLEYCSSLLEFFPLVNQPFNNLCELNMRNCKKFQIFGQNIRFPSLITLNLNGCISLKVFPPIFGNKIKRLYMRRTAIDNVPSSIKELSELVKLDLAKCRRLNHISTSICKLKDLEYLNLSNCSALECFPEILETMESLEILDLSGTTIKELHRSIENCASLYKLHLRECKNLELLPISIYNLSCLADFSGCSQLKILPGNSVTLSSRGESITTHQSPIYRLGNCDLCFTNCLNLNTTAISNIMEVQINEHRHMKIKGYESQAVNLRFCYPGSEVPRWFKWKNVGSWIKIEMSGHDHVNGQLIGLAACVVMEFDKCSSADYDDEDLYDGDYDDDDDDEDLYDDGYYGDEDLVVRYHYCCHCENNEICLTDPIPVTGRNKTLIDSDHVALWYSDASNLALCEIDRTEYLFEFVLEEKSSKYRVKRCGVCPIYEKHNITLPSIANDTCGATDQDFRGKSVKEQAKIRKLSDEAETSGRSNEDVIEPHPKRTCS